MYALNNKDEFVELESYLYNCQESISRSAATLPDFTFEEAAVDLRAVAVSRKASFKESISLLSSYSIMCNKALNVPYCANGENEAFPGGYCWVASTASIISFRKPTLKSIEEIKRDLLDELGVNRPEYTDEQVKSILEREISTTFTTRNGYPNIFATLSQSKPIIFLIEK